jgi:U3 small nucleolar RNA-associated protein 4
VAFWSWTTGTLVKELQPHLADVLALAVAPDGRVFSTGVDRALMQITPVPPSTSDPVGDWIVAGKKRYHSHDVTALLYLPRPYDALVSGTHLISRC